MVSKAAKKETTRINREQSAAKEIAKQEQLATEQATREQAERDLFEQLKSKFESDER